MIGLREKNMEAYLSGMQKYFEKVQKMDKEQAKQLLIRGGVLEEDGKTKEQICDGGMYTENRLNRYEKKIEDIYITCNEKLSNSYQYRVDVAKSLFGILSTDMVLEEAREERLNTIREP